jgi:hypothetical protein
MRRRDDDDGPRRFVRKWLRFDQARPTRPALAWKFVVTVALVLIVSAVLAWISAHMRR